MLLPSNVTSVTSVTGCDGDGDEWYNPLMQISDPRFMKILLYIVEAIMILMVAFGVFSCAVWIASPIVR